ncbi:hypothetical protein [Campylobacter devanensis]|uniref:hypothetical protein n=1 Tax=Campylobacter devanensis TaxID=3161138 RepID=UPI000A34A893|nr:hypothetical protein [Campylobacter sp. P0227]
MKEIPLNILKDFLDLWYEDTHSYVPVEFIEEAVKEIEEFDFINIKERLLQSLKDSIKYEKDLKLKEGRE